MQAERPPGFFINKGMAGYIRAYMGHPSEREGDTWAVAHLALSHLVWSQRTGTSVIVIRVPLCGFEQVTGEFVGSAVMKHVRPEEETVIKCSPRPTSEQAEPIGICD